jgi:hypothetical protein
MVGALWRSRKEEKKESPQAGPVLMPLTRGIYVQHYEARCGWEISHGTDIHLYLYRREVHIVLVHYELNEQQDRDTSQ